jgi:hypothetical protein
LNSVAQLLLLKVNPIALGHPLRRTVVLLAPSRVRNQRPVEHISRCAAAPHASAGARRERAGRGSFSPREAVHNMVPGRGHVGMFRGGPCASRRADTYPCGTAYCAMAPMPLGPATSAHPRTGRLQSTPRMQTQTPRTVESDRRASPLCRGRLLPGIACRLRCAGCSRCSSLKNSDQKLTISKIPPLQPVFDA